MKKQDVFDVAPDLRSADDIDISCKRLRRAMVSVLKKAEALQLTAGQARAALEEGGGR